MHIDHVTTGEMLGKDLVTPFPGTRGADRLLHHGLRVGTSGGDKRHRVVRLKLGHHGLGLREHGPDSLDIPDLSTTDWVLTKPKSLKDGGFAWAGLSRTALLLQLDSVRAGITPALRAEREWHLSLRFPNPSSEQLVRGMR